ncbi:MAG: hypothetical protein FD122_3257 [Stygiobacter sp.]|nr:MAG: hypothetical protein FD122_3257 [Stygiobacter sp.]KAF0215418.1 MAG: hypothetical protein FD178_1702 [Ignavibacteria bacterium]
MVTNECRCSRIETFTCFLRLISIISLQMNVVVHGLKQFLIDLTIGPLIVTNECRCSRIETPVVICPSTTERKVTNECRCSRIETKITTTKASSDKSYK